MLFIIPNGIAFPLGLIAIGLIYFLIFRSVKDDPREKEDERTWFDAERKVIRFNKPLKKAK